MDDATNEEVAVHQPAAATQAQLPSVSGWQQMGAYFWHLS